MASPQIENGYTRFANELMEALMRTNLSAYQSRILWAIWRQTYGYQKTRNWLSNSQLVQMTGIRKQHISRVIRELIQRKIVTKSGYNVSFNKDYTQWRELPKQVTLPKLVTKVTSIGDNSNQSRGTQKKKNKINNNADRTDFNAVTADQTFIAKLQNIYPNIDIQTCIRDMEAWFLTHAPKKDYYRFVTNWIKNEARKQRVTNPEAKDDPIEKALKRMGNHG